MIMDGELKLIKHIYKNFNKHKMPVKNEKELKDEI